MKGIRVPGRPPVAADWKRATAFTRSIFLGVYVYDQFSNNKSAVTRNGYLPVRDGLPGPGRLRAAEGRRGRSSGPLLSTPGSNIVR